MVIFLYYMNPFILKIELWRHFHEQDIDDDYMLCKVE